MGAKASASAKDVASSTFSVLWGFLFSKEAIVTPLQFRELNTTTLRDVQSGNGELLKQEYVVIETREALKTCLSELKKSIKVEPILAVDCEGEKLSRTGALQILSVATRTKAYLVDILTLKTEPFETGFRDILEKSGIKKLMFDCRQDADALFHQFHVKLDGVLDIQLLEIIKRPHTEAKSTTKRRSERLDEVVRLKGLLDCIDVHIGNVAIREKKRRGAELRDRWGERPLSTVALEYASIDVLALFQLYEQLLPNDEEMKRLEVASSIYVDLKRSRTVPIDDMFDGHCYLPIDVIPEKGQTSFQAGYMSCVACKRYFQYDEFSKNQLRKNIQKCRTCKRVKNDRDVRLNREANIERDEAWLEMRASMFEFEDYDEYDPTYWD